MQMFGAQTVSSRKLCGSYIDEVSLKGKVVEIL